MRSVTIRLTCLLALVAAVASARGGATDPKPRSDIADCEVTRPRGNYALATLELTIPGGPKHVDRRKRKARKWTYVGGLRDGRMRVDDGVGLREPGGWLEARDGRLTGSFRRVDLGATVSIDAAIADGSITGMAKVGDRSATVSGKYITEAELARRNAVARDKSWPAAQGPLDGGCSAQWTGVPTIDDVAELRMAWRCEESDIGRGMGNITRFMINWKDASSRRTGSGCASPLVAEGKVFFKYFVPAPRDFATPEMVIREYSLWKATESSAGERMLEQARRAGFAGETLPGYAVEKTFQCADDIVLCMDAATGKTLWKAVVKKRGVNSQHHKAGPFDMSPAYANGRVFALGMSGWLYAFDAATGKPLWEVRSERDYSNALLAVGDVLIAPAARQWGGYDVTTGKLSWKAGVGRAMSTLSAWSHGGRDYLIGVMGPNHARRGIGCLEAATGEQVWNLPVNVMTGGRGLGPGGITVIGDRMLVNQNNGTGKKRDPIKPVIAAYGLTPTKAQPLWEIGPDANTARVESLRGKSAHFGPVHQECVPVVVRGKYVFTADLRVADLATGKVLAKTRGLAPMNGGYMQAIEDMVLVRRDGTHGNMECGFYKVADDGSVRSLAGEGSWTPPIGGTTTSYHHPIFYPMVDGRVFFRQENGVYCWDLRKP
jgi:outer membrane protein assembly factor BamB